MTTANLQHLIQSDARATARVLRYLRGHGIDHHDTITGAALGAVCGVDSRSWRRWVDGTRTMPAMARRLLCQVSGVELPWVALPVERIPKALRHEYGDELLVRLANGSEVQAWWRSQVGGMAGAYYDADGEPLEPVAVLHVNSDASAVALCGSGDFGAGTSAHCNVDFGAAIRSASATVEADNAADCAKDAADWAAEAATLAACAPITGKKNIRHLGCLIATCWHGCP